MTSVYTGASVITSVFSTSNTVLLRGNKRFYLTEYIEVSPWYFEKRWPCIASSFCNSFCTLTVRGLRKREGKKKNKKGKGRSCQCRSPFYLHSPNHSIKEDSDTCGECSTLRRFVGLELDLLRSQAGQCPRWAREWKRTARKRSREPQGTTNN